MKTVLKVGVNNNIFLQFILYLITISLFVEVTDNREEVERSHDWLKNNFEPWEDVLYHWEKSFLRRKNLIRDRTTYPHLCSLLDDWNILTSSMAYVLVNNFQYIWRIIYLFNIFLL